jgi:hypothetical protein
VKPDKGEEGVRRLWAESVKHHAGCNGVPLCASQPGLRLSDQKGTQRCFLENRI